ncbi:uncharacterized protein A4U43_C02F9010 [Asparagus officinalis]|uniref:Uncharacterized protein n=1 Tax=Asparagus officinalis TaxID=4686 RepID=A0A5P1FL20_ASPOF|nr:uncharacterized protein A4U43_C02F9010 [Asparagus officinalis]
MTPGAAAMRSRPSENFWKVSACDICEIATNSVYQSGFSHALKLCKNPQPKPDIKTPSTNHTCAPTNGARPPPSTNGPLVGPIPKSGPFLPLRTNSTVCLEDIECVVQAPEFLPGLQAPKTYWTCVMENLDHEGFNIPDETSFSLLMSIYNKACETYTDSANLSNGVGNQAWSCLDLLDVLCQLAESGHASSVWLIIEHPLNQFPDVLLLGVAQINVGLRRMKHQVRDLFSTEIIASISDIKFGHEAPDIKFGKDGRHILSRDYMTLKLWDISMDSGPVATFQNGLDNSTIQSVLKGLVSLDKSFNEKNSDNLLKQDNGLSRLKFVDNDANWKNGSTMAAANRKKYEIVIMQQVYYHPIKH